MTIAEQFLNINNNESVYVADNFALTVEQFADDVTTMVKDVTVIIFKDKSGLLAKDNVVLTVL